MAAASAATFACPPSPSSSQHRRQLQALHHRPPPHRNDNRSCAMRSSTAGTNSQLRRRESVCRAHSSRKYRPKQVLQLSLCNHGGAGVGDRLPHCGVRSVALIGRLNRTVYRSRPHTKERRLQGVVLAISADASAQASPGNKNVAILWFKKDLRLDDHPGLSLSTAYQSLLPVYIFDPYLLRGWSGDLLEALVEAVAELRLALQGMGSDLIIRHGNVKAELSSLAAEVQAEAIIAEEEIDHEWQETVSSLKESLNIQVTVETWKALLYENKGKPFPTSYKVFLKMKYSAISPLQTSDSLPGLPKVIDKGDIPPASAIEDDVNNIFENNIWHKTMRDLKCNGAEALLNMKDNILEDELPSRASSGIFKGLTSWREKYILASPHEALEKRRQELALLSEKIEVQKKSGSGTISIRDTLDAYLRFLEPTRREDWRKLYEVVSEAEYYGPRGASFRTIFGNALTLGSLSRRRIYHEAFEYEKARNGGWSSPFGFSTFTAIAAVNDVKSSEWYRLLAAASEEDSRNRGWDVRTWIWRGFHIEYVAEGDAGVPIVLVHGFGAFWEHYRDNIRKLAVDGNRVWALSLLGFGRSEKPDVAYTEILWAELLRDFVVEVVGEPAILVGNSIGGYMVSMVAGVWPQLIKGLILLNAAGGVLPEQSSNTYSQPKARTGVTWAGSKLSLTYLRSAASQLLKKYYCVNPSRIDEWLIQEILRASHDPGAAIVIESFYCLKNPFPLNWFLDRYNGMVLAIQGSKDPLSNGQKRKQLFESYCSNVEVELVEAGHCPHDEIPDEVNALILKWLQKNQLQQAERSALTDTVQYVS